jgi:lysozyme
VRIINAAGLALIEHFEGLRLEAYQDVAGIWTIGYGHTRGVYPGQTMTQQEAQQALQDDLLSAQGAVENAVGTAPTNDDQFAAMVSLCFNIGSGNYRSSTVLRDHRAGNYAPAADAFLLWNKATINGVLTPVAGLTARRTAERQLYLS